MNLVSKSLSFVGKFLSRLRKNWCTKAGGLAILVVLALIFLLREVPVLLLSPAAVKRSQRIVKSDPYLIDTPACRIANLQANSDEAMKYMFNVDPVDCGKPPLVESNDTHLRIVHSALPKYGIEDVKSLACCYRPMWRHDPNITIKPGDTNASWLYDGKVYDKDIRYHVECFQFEDSIAIDHHFVRVECKNGHSSHSKEIYRDFHAFFPTPPPFKRRQSGSDSRGDCLEKTVNVLILGIDSLSRLNLIRKMPLTYRYIAKTLQGIPMFGYNKIGLNTFPNLVPLLSSLTVDELSSSCWPNTSAHFDLCWWIWDYFASKGYRTAYMEDSPDIGVFTYLKYGFVAQRTDYDTYTLFVAALKEISHNYYYCFGPRTQIEVLLNLTLKNLRTMRRRGEKYAAMSWGVSHAHDLINQPQVADHLYHNFLRDIHADGTLNNTVLIFMSDHGLRFGGFLETEQGILEGNLPALFFVIPEWFQREYSTAMRNLRQNQHRLLTTLDLHATLLDLGDLSRIEVETIERRTRDSMHRGISLFLPIPENRSCRDARIPDEFCACEHLKKIDVDQPQVAEIAQFIADEINYRILRNDSLCVPWTVSRIQTASQGLPFLISNQIETVIEYEVSVFMDPGYALFSALVRHFTSNDTMEVVGEVSRLNKYGSQSRCMKTYTLLPFCYCKGPYELHRTDK